MTLLIKGGLVVDPASGLHGARDVLIEDGRIARLEPSLPADGAHVVEVPHGWIVCPGLIDMHVHLREPGQEHKETVATGCAAAVAGGFTAVACMPNTDPINDQASVTELILRRAAEAGLARVYPIGAVSRGSRGEQMADIGELHAAGCVAVSDDGRPVATALLMRRALEYAGMFGMPVINHCEDPSLKADGVAHEGAHASLLGLKGIPAAAEAIMVERDVTLAELTRSAVHIAHMSVRGSLRAVRDGKTRGAPVTCEVAPHHFTLTDEALAGVSGPGGRGPAYDTNVKMNPPLREAADRDAMIQGLADGSIDAIATDHAPHHYDEKEVEFDLAPFGIVGLETAVPLVFDRLVHAGHIGVPRMVELLSLNPARILRLEGGTLAPGARADVTLLAPDLPVIVSAARFRSKSKNTPFDGWNLRGGVGATIVGGRIVYVNVDAPGAANLVAEAGGRGAEARR
jgi:dihydroorotase